MGGGDFAHKKIHIITITKLIQLQLYTSKHLTPNTYTYIDNKLWFWFSSPLINVSTLARVTVYGNSTFKSISFPKIFVSGLVNRNKFSFVKMISKHLFKLRTPASSFVNFLFDTKY